MTALVIAVLVSIYVLTSLLPGWMHSRREELRDCLDGYDPDRSLILPIVTARRGRRQVERAGDGCLPAPSPATIDNPEESL